MIQAKRCVRRTNGRDTRTISVDVLAAARKDEAAVLDDGSDGDSSISPSTSKFSREGSRKQSQIGLGMAWAMD